MIQRPSIVRRRPSLSASPRARVPAAVALAAMLAVPAAGCSSSSGAGTVGGGGGQAGAGQGGSSAGSPGAAGQGGTTGSGAGAAGEGGATAGSGGSAAGGEAQGGSGGDVMPTHLPAATATCPEMSNLQGTAVAFAGQQATVWSGDPTQGPGPLLIYWYATGSNAGEPAYAIGLPQIAKITAMGGAVVAQNKTIAKGSTTGNNVWYTGDAAIADEIVACAIATQKIDPRRIHTAGYSAGGLQATYLWYARSGYLASVLTYSGGDDIIDKTTMQDPEHPPAALVTHGAKGKDTYGGQIDFFDASTTWEKELKQANAFVIDCNDGGAHTDFALRTKIAPQAIQFFLDHPYGVKPEPYAALPAGWPDYCAIE